MKNMIKIFGTFAVAVVSALGFTACSDDSYVGEISAPDDRDSNKVEVSINLGGDITSYVDAMTRADDPSNDLYAILVEDASTNDVYAYGVFDGNNLSNLTVALDREETYNFRAGMIRDAKNQIYHKEETRYVNNSEVTEVRYWSPYSAYESDFNKFMYVSDGNYSYAYPNSDINWAFDSSPENHYYRSVPVDRYYGEKDSYTPTENAAFTIDMLRMSFQLVIDVKNLGEGEKIVITSRDIIIPDIEIDSTNPKYDEIYSYGNVNDAYASALEQQENEDWVSLKMKWYDADGNLKNLKTKMTSFSLKCERGKKQTVEINLTSFEGADESGAITFEEDEEMTSGGSYTVDKDGKH